MSKIPTNLSNVKPSWVAMGAGAFVIIATILATSLFSPRLGAASTGGQNSGQDVGMIMPVPTAPGTAESKVTICHRTGSGYVQITVSRNAIPAHRKHGDIIPAPEGGCPGAGTPTTSVTAVSTRTAESTRTSVATQTAQGTRTGTPGATRTVEGTVRPTHTREALRQPKRPARRKARAPLRLQPQ